jgi:NAD(P)H-hydrate epimerase
MKTIMKAKKEFRDGIVVSRSKIEDYISEADCVLIGPGLPRKEGLEKGDDDTKLLTESLLKKFPRLRWVLDGGSLQTIDPEILKLLKEPILTPHYKEFELLKSKITDSEFKIKIEKLKLEDQVKIFAEKYGCTIVLKGRVDFICSPEKCIKIKGGNAGMTKGGTGDVLAALIASLYCKNDAFLSACAGSYFNKKAGENLFEKVGLYYNTSDLADELPHILKEFIL